ncbi:hypothetical protein CPB86DRAFT_874438 [Serendipita vermifera]|nr:hypothetical protein CPB86DRAFT_874438 [Serendipita vermifera]
MLFSPRLIFILAILQVHGSSLPHDNGQADTVSITCESLDDIPLRPMILKGIPDAQNPVLPAKGVPVALFDHLLRASDTTGTFKFRPCKSTFMNLTSSLDGSVKYGHVVSSEDQDPPQCLGTILGQVTAQNITSTNCSIADNSGQMQIFWQLTSNSLGGDTIDFVGTRLVDSIKWYYTMVVAGEEGSYLPQLVRHDRGDNTDFKSLYQLAFEH